MKKSFVRTLCGLALMGTAAAEANVKLGFGVDQGLGVMLQFNNKVNAFVGNDGLSVDYLFVRKRLADMEGTPLNWTLGAGGFAEWNHGFGVRVPLGLEVPFARGWDAMVFAAPAFDFDDTKFQLDLGIGVRYAF
ncbi:hypothetical protein [Ferrimonas gelatinilytica]